VEEHVETFEMGYEDRFERQYGFLRPYIGLSVFDCFFSSKCPGGGKALFPVEKLVDSVGQTSLQA
jgi:hypothetical protein